MGIILSPCVPQVYPRLFPVRKVLHAEDVLQWGQEQIWDLQKEKNFKDAFKIENDDASECCNYT